jgi:5-methylcytosine-specific restriction endonuclease McrA
MNRRTIGAKTDWHCWYCGRELHDDAARWKQNEYMHIEHQNPKSNEGESVIDNLVPSCHTCNGRKGTKSIAQFHHYMRFINVGIEPMTPAQIEWCNANGFDVMATIPEVVFYGEKQSE